MNFKKIVLALLAGCSISTYGMEEQYNDLQADGYTVSEDKEIIVACVTGNIATVNNLLFNRGMDINRKLDVNGHILGQLLATPLLVAVQSRQFELAKFLIEQGADLETTDWKGDTALMWAVRNHDINLIELLIRNKANIEARNVLGMTILHQCIDENSEHCLELVILLVNQGANPNSIDERSLFTPLLYAASKGNEDVVNYILSCRVPVNTGGLMRETALILATQGGHAGTVKLLLDAGILTSPTDFWGDTSLDIAQKHGFSNIINLLSQDGEQEIDEDIEMSQEWTELSKKLRDF